MFELNTQESSIYNQGERLIPGITHNLDEEIRHRSTYNFFKKIIENDLQDYDSKTFIKILDLGCGTGHGSKLLSNIPNVFVYSVDISNDAIEYAKKNYNAKNISYKFASMQDILSEQDEYDYIVSRHAVEHIDNGINQCLLLKFKRRMIINVPYNESPGNEFHLINNITASNFSSFPNHEIFYEDLNGVTVDDVEHPNNNSIICVSSKDNFSGIRDFIIFPFPAWVAGNDLIQQYKILELHRRISILEIKRIDQLESDIRNSFILRAERKILKIFKKIFSRNQEKS